MNGMLRNLETPTYVIICALGERARVEREKASWLRT